MSSIKELTETAIKRYLNPTILTLIVTWLLWNWKLVLFLLFGNQDIQRKIDIIQTDYSSLLYNYAFPLLSTSAILFIGPWIMLFISWVNSFSARKIEKHEIRKKAFSKFAAEALSSNTDITELVFKYLEKVHKLKNTENEVSKMSEHYELLMNMHSQIIEAFDDPKSKLLDETSFNLKALREEATSLMEKLKKENIDLKTTNHMHRLLSNLFNSLHTKQNFIENLKSSLQHFDKNFANLKSDVSKLKKECTIDEQISSLLFAFLNEKSIKTEYQSKIHQLVKHK